MLPFAVSVESGRTAIVRKKPSRPLAAALEKGIVTSPALDWGSGRGFDVEYLGRVGVEAFGFDPVHAPVLPARRDFKYGQVVYVLNVIRDPEEKIGTLRLFREYLSPDARVVFAVRSNRDVTPKMAAARNWRPVPGTENAYIVNKRGRYQEGYSAERLVTEVSAVGFSEVEASRRGGMIICFARP